MHFDIAYLLNVAQLLMPVLVTGAAGWIVKHIKTPTDAQRAQVIGQMANGAVALVLMNNRGNGWAQLLKQAVDQILTNFNPPTQNRAVLERAVASALIGHGVKPDTQK